MKMRTCDIFLSLDALQTQTKPVKMMNQTEEFPLTFIPEIKSQVLELPYVGKNLSMLIILPDEIQDETTGLQKVRQQRLWCDFSLCGIAG